VQVGWPYAATRGDPRTQVTKDSLNPTVSTRVNKGLLLLIVAGITLVASLSMASRLRRGTYATCVVVDSRDWASPSPEISSSDRPDVSGKTFVSKNPSTAAPPAT
jgi:hypothetical protein